MYTPSWGTVTLSEVPAVFSLMFAETTVTTYPLEGAGNGAVQVTSIVVRLVCSALKLVTGAPRPT